MNASLNTNLDRQKYLGGSDVAAILGISPWKTPLDVYLDKIQPRVEVTDPAKLKLFRRGHRMEPYVIDLLAEEENLTIVARGNRYIDKQHGFIAAEIDAEAEGNLNIEIKTVSPFKAKEWGEQQTDEIPVHYTAQVMHGLMVTDRETCILGVLIGGDDFRVYRVVRDEEIIGAIRDSEIAFWDRIQNRMPPEPSTVGDIARLYGTKDSGLSVEATEAIAATCVDMRSVIAEMKSLEEHLEMERERVQLDMGDAATLMYQGKPLATWKSQSASRFDQAAFKTAHADLYEQFKKISESRVFRLK